MVMFVFHSKLRIKYLAAVHILHRQSSLDNGAMQDSPILDAKSFNESCATKQSFPPPTLVLVIARGRGEDISWLRHAGNLSHNALVYQEGKDIDSDLQRSGVTFVAQPGTRKLREAGFYINALLDNYNKPSWTHMAFFHAHQRSWHSLLTNDWIVRRWSLGWSPPASMQYANVHCRQTSNADTRDVTTRQILLGTDSINTAPDSLLRSNSQSIVVHAWEEFFGHWLGKMPAVVHGPW